MSAVFSDVNFPILDDGSAHVGGCEISLLSLSVSWLPSTKAPKTTLDFVFAWTGADGMDDLLGSYVWYLVMNNLLVLETGWMLHLS